MTTRPGRRSTSRGEATEAGSTSPNHDGVAGLAASPAAPTPDAAPAVFLTPEELARRWRFVVTARTLRNWRAMARGPAWKAIGSRVLYAVADVERYERERDGQFLLRNPVSR